MSILTKKDNCIFIEGEMSFITVPELQKDILRDFNKISTLTIDFDKAITRDISAIALLISLARFAKKNDKSISFINAKDKLLDLAKFSHVFELLPFEITPNNV